MGDKVSAINAMKKAGVPCAPDQTVLVGADINKNKEIAKRIGYQLLLKPPEGQWWSWNACCT